METENYAWLAGVIDGEGSLMIAKNIRRVSPLNKERLRLFAKAVELRKRKKWGARRVSKALGISENTLEEWFYGTKRPRAAVANPTGEIYTPTLAVVNTDKRLIQKVADLCGLTTIEEKPPEHRIGKKTLYLVRTNNSRKVLAVLEKLYPYLVAKKRKAEILMELCKVELSTPLAEKRTSPKYHEQKRRLYQALKSI